MSRLPGVPLRGTPLSAAQAEALALRRFWNAVPGARLADLYRPGLNVSQLARRVTAILAAQHTDG